MGLYICNHAILLVSLAGLFQVLLSARFCWAIMVIPRIVFMVHSKSAGNWLCLLFIVCMVPPPTDIKRMHCMWVFVCVSAAIVRLKFFFLSLFGSAQINSWNLDIAYVRACVGWKTRQNMRKRNHALNNNALWACEASSKKKCEGSVRLCRTNDKQRMNSEFAQTPPFISSSQAKSKIE